MAIPLATVAHTLFFVFGITLVASAVIVSVIGLKFESFPPSRAALLGVLAYFAVLVAATMTAAVRNSQEEQQASQAEASAPASTSTTPTSTSATPSQATGGSSINISADPTGQLKFEETAVTAKAGKDTLNFTNKSPVGHNVQIQDSSGKLVGGTKTITGTSTSTTVDLKPGKYTFFCSIPGHEQAGMKGTLTVK